MIKNNFRGASDVNGGSVVQNLSNFDNLKGCSDLVTARRMNYCPALLFYLIFSPSPRMKCLWFLPRRSQIQIHALMHLAKTVSLVRGTMGTAKLVRRKGSGSALIHPANVHGSWGNPSLPHPIVILLCTYYI